MFDFRLYSILFFTAGILILTIIAVVWARRPARGMVPFSFFLLAAALWAFCAGFETGAPSLEVRILIVKIQYIGVVSSGIFWLFFTLDFAGYRWWKRPRYSLLFALLPAAVLALLWNPATTDLIWSNIYITEQNGIVYSVWEHGPLFLINPIYQYLMYSAGFIVFLRYGLRQSRVFRNQTFIILAGTSLPCLYNVLYVFGFNPIIGMDLTPICMLAGALVYAFTILQFRFMSFLPIAYQTLVHSIPDSILILDEQNRIIEVNLAFEKLVGINSLQLRSRTLGEIWPDLDSTLKIMETGHKMDLQRTDENGPRNFHVDTVDLQSSRKINMGRLVIVRDITELKQAQLNLEDEIRKRSQYSRSLVHELRTPLTSIIACSDMLDTLVENPTARSLTHNIQRAASNMDRRVEELFELARGEIGLLKIEPVPLDLCDLIGEVVSETGPVAERKGLTLSYTCNPGLIVMGEKDRLRQVLSNLIGNAIKFSPEGLIEIRLSRRDHQALIQVVDNGIGIAPEQMEYLFDPYRRKPSADQRSAGLGVGLALSKIIVELHQGQIWAESAPGMGAVLNISLPLTES